MAQPALARVLSLPMLTLYGLGTTIGAGIYALIGEIAGTAGYGAPWAFLIASLVAALTACSFSELAARFPRAAGAALYVQAGFQAPALGRLVGLAVVAAGVVSAAALVNGFAGYLQAFLPAARVLIVLPTTLLIIAVAAWGIAESVRVAAIITLVEAGGLVLLIALGAADFAELPARWREFLPGSDPRGWHGILLGVTLAFYAFIGFEDMVDVAEEVRDVRRNLPRAIGLTLAITCALYFVLMISALLAMRPAELAADGAPLASLYARHTGMDPLPLAVVAMFAIINGALIQVVMASRVLYGLASRGQLPGWLAGVNTRTRTPLAATAMAGAALLGLALAGRLAGLAATTSMIMLGIFTAVNLALWRLKGRPDDGSPGLRFPRVLSLLGAVLSAALVMRELVVVLL